MINEPTQNEEHGYQGYAIVVKTPDYAPAPKAGCDCPPTAPCRISGICTCDLAALAKKLKQETENKNGR